MPEITCRKCGGKLQDGAMTIGSHEIPVLDCPKCGSQYVTGKDARAIKKKVEKKMRSSKDSKKSI